MLIEWEYLNSPTVDIIISNIYIIVLKINKFYSKKGQGIYGNGNIIHFEHLYKMKIKTMA